MAFLTPDKIITAKIGNEALTINQKIMPATYLAPWYVASHVQKGQPMKPCALLAGTGKPKGITVHNTPMITAASGTNAAEQYCRSTYNGNMGGVIVHFYVWRSIIWQLLEETERGWHATDGSTRRISQRKGETIGGNLDTIAIECIGADAESEDTTAKLAAYLLQPHSLIPDTDVYNHRYFYPIKYCPAYILPHWEDFMGQVAGYYNTGTAENDGLYRVQCDAFQDWDYALAQYQRLVADGYKPYMITADGYFKVQVDAFQKKSGAETRAAELKAKGYNTYITTKAGVPVSMA